jgi:cytochrome c556
MDKSKQVEELIDKAAKANNAVDALQFSQAACNAANAMCAVGHALHSGDVECPSCHKQFKVAESRAK